MIDIDVDTTWVAVVRAAAFYRKMEQDHTPYLYRGKELHECGLHLDGQLEKLENELGEEIWNEIVDL